MNACMICKNCNKEIPEESRYCLHCGAKQPKVNRKKQKKSVAPKKSSMDTILLVVILIVASIAAFYLLYPDNKVSVTKQTQFTPDPFRQQELTSVLDLLKKNPNDYGLLVKAGNNYYDIEKFANAVQYYDKALTIKNSEPEVIIDAGVCYYNLQNLDKAENYFRNALAINPNHPVGLYNLGIVLSSKGQPEKAAEVWHKILEVAPQSPQAKAIDKMLHSPENN